MVLKHCIGQKNVTDKIIFCTHHEQSILDVSVEYDFSMYLKNQKFDLHKCISGRYQIGKASCVFLLSWKYTLTKPLLGTDAKSDPAILLLTYIAGE